MKDTKVRGEGKNRKKWKKRERTERTTAENWEKGWSRRRRCRRRRREKVMVEDFEQEDGE